MEIFLCQYGVWHAIYGTSISWYAKINGLFAGNLLTFQSGNKISPVNNSYNLIVFLFYPILDKTANNVLESCSFVYLSKKKL
jgi:hypothetical protein